MSALVTSRLWDYGSFLLFLVLCYLFKVWKKLHGDFWQRKQTCLPGRSGAAFLGSRRTGVLARVSPRGASEGPLRSSALSILWRWHLLQRRRRNTWLVTTSLTPQWNTPNLTVCTPSDSKYHWQEIIPVTQLRACTKLQLIRRVLTTEFVRRNDWNTQYQRLGWPCRASAYWTVGH